MGSIVRDALSEAQKGRKHLFHSNKQQLGGEGQQQPGFESHPAAAANRLTLEAQTEACTIPCFLAPLMV